MTSELTKYSSVFLTLLLTLIFCKGIEGLVARLKTDQALLRFLRSVGYSSTSFQQIWLLRRTLHGTAKEVLFLRNVLTFILESFGIIAMSTLLFLLALLGIGFFAFKDTVSNGDLNTFVFSIIALVLSLIIAVLNLLIERFRFLCEKFDCERGRP
jgi:hypothetical protein